MRPKFKNSEVCLKTVDTSSVETLQAYLANFIVDDVGINYSADEYPGISPHVFESAIKLFVERFQSNLDILVKEFYNDLTEVKTNLSAGKVFEEPFVMEFKDGEPGDNGVVSISHNRVKKIEAVSTDKTAAKLKRLLREINRQDLSAYEAGLLKQALDILK
jgi:hypothetical protein